MRGGVEDRQILTAEGQEAGALALEGETPGGGGFVGVGGAEVGDVGHGAQGHQVLDGLVRGAVFADADGVVGEDEERVNLHERGEAQGRLGVIREHKEGGSEGNAGRRGPPCR